MSGQVSCEGIVLRLVDGDRSADDPVLAEHLGSCLSCFRVAAELRELPQLARAMREDAAAVVAAADPGEVFFRELAARTVERWDRQRSGAEAAAGTVARANTAAVNATAASETNAGNAASAAAAAATVRARDPAPATEVVRPSPWRLLTGWLRAPLPAAFAGAAVAAVVAVIVVEAGHLTEPGNEPGPEMLQATGAPATAGRGTAATAGDPAPAAATADEEITPAGLLGDEDPWDALEPRDLRRVVARLDEAFGKLPAVDDDVVEIGPSPTEELESLDGDDLRTVARELVERGI